MKTQDRQSLVCQPSYEGRHARTPPSAFPFLHITMSKSRSGCGRSHLPNPRWKQIHHQESTTAAASPESDSVKLRSCPKDRAVAYSPAGSGSNPREGCHLSAAPPLVKGSTNRSFRISLFGLVVTIEATFLPECAATHAIVNGEVTIRGIVWLRDPPNGGYLRDLKIFRSILDAAPCAANHATIYRASQGRTSRRHNVLPR